MYNLVAVIGISLLLTGCSLIPDTTTNTGTVTTGTEVTTGDQTGSISTTGTQDRPDEYIVTFDRRTTNEETVDIYHTSGKPTSVYFINTDATSMTVEINTEGTGNLRWSQVVMPDGQMDGPFGTDTDYGLTQVGRYKLIFNENMMAGDPWSGDAQVTIRLRTFVLRR